VRAAGLEPAQLFRAEGFSYQLRLSPPSLAASWRLELVCGLDYTFILSALTLLDAARLVSTPSSSRSAGSLARDCHAKGFPEFEQFYASSFLEGTQLWLKSLASTNFATPAFEIRGLARHSSKRNEAIRLFPKLIPCLSQPCCPGKASIATLAGALRKAPRLRNDVAIGRHIVVRPRPLENRHAAGRT
jgi:hypothetical protein